MHELIQIPVGVIIHVVVKLYEVFRRTVGRAKKATGNTAFENGLFMRSGKSKTAAAYFEQIFQADNSAAYPFPLRGVKHATVRFRGDDKFFLFKSFFMDEGYGLVLPDEFICAQKIGKIDEHRFQKLVFFKYPFL